MPSIISADPPFMEDRDDLKRRPGFCFLVTPINQLVSDYSWEVYIQHSGVLFCLFFLVTPINQFLIILGMCTLYTPVCLQDEPTCMRIEPVQGSLTCTGDDCPCTGGLHRRTAHCIMSFL